MRELEKTDIETGEVLRLPFFLLTDGSMITSYVFRPPSDVAYAGLNTDIFEPCKPRLITKEEISQDMLRARLDSCPNAVHWAAQRLDSLWSVSEVRSFAYTDSGSRFVGYLSGGCVRDLLPKAYQKLQGKREELARAQQEFEKYIDTLRPRFAGEALF